MKGKNALWCLIVLSFRVKQALSCVFSAVKRRGKARNLALPRNMDGRDYIAQEGCAFLPGWSYTSSLLQYLETNGETGGFAIYCQPRHKGSLILSQDSVGGVLEERSHYVLDSTSGEAGQYRCRPNQERVT